MVEVKLCNLLNGFNPLMEIMDYNTRLTNIGADPRAEMYSKHNIRYKFTIHEKEYQVYFDKVSLSIMVSNPDYNKWVKQFNLPSSFTSFHIAFGLEFNGGLLQDLTGTGDAPLVFTMVYRSIIKFLEEINEDVSVLFFASYLKEPTRVKLYDRFTPMLTKHLDREFAIHNNMEFEAKIYAMIDTN
jgi:hypothetical protein